MAKRIQPDEIPNRGSRSGAYPWSEWLDGTSWQLTMGEDFDVPTQSFATYARTVIRQRGLALKVVERRGSVYIYPLDQ